jgi:pyruvate-formate lyase-activating enzyme
VVRAVSASSGGRITAHDRLRAIARTGWEEGDPDRLIPLPQGAALMHLPGRHAVGRDASGARVVLDQEAVAAVLPPGYLRTWLPAYEEEAGAPVLPLYGYAAVASIDGVPHAAAVRTDRWAAWNPDRYQDREVARGLAAAARALPDNRLVPHLTVCATDYRCLTAKNLFLREGEGAIPVSPACNAACLGCISEQWGDVDSPQTRLEFAPSAIEIAELAAWHLAANPHNFVSFGQGCEGEPLTRGRVLVDATRRIHAAAPQAAIHINTNGSRPGVLEDLVGAGLNSTRISIFSLDDECFRAYYRPIGYGLDEVAACADILRAAGGQVTVNLLTFPGISDRPAEIEALVGFVRDHGVQQVQLRSLNVDPLWLLRRIPARSPGIGMRAFVRELRQRCPELRLGNFTRPWAQPSRALVGIA